MKNEFVSIKQTCHFLLRKTDKLKLGGKCLVLLGVLFPHASALALSGTMTSLNSDGQIQSSGSSISLVYQANTYCRTGGHQYLQNNTVYVFSLPSSVISDPSQRFSAASFRISLMANAATATNADVYGLPFSQNSAILTSQYYLGPRDPAVPLIKDNFLVSSSQGQTVTLSNGRLVDYLNSALETARQNGASGGCVFLRLSPDAASNWGNYFSGMTEASGTAAPRLTYETDTISPWRTVPLGGGGFVTGLLSDKAGDTIYCRTDVGGVFRWSGTSGEWTSLTDRIVPVDTPYACKLAATNSFAIDPVDSDQIYVALGTSTTSQLHGIYSSSDGGLTWAAINSNIQMTGQGKSTGERLAIDPNNPNILWYGSCVEGLWKGVRSGGIWTWSAVPSSSVPFGQVPQQSDQNKRMGVTFVVCDRDGLNTNIYAGVFDSVGTTGGVYYSPDGVTWGKVAGMAFPTPIRAQVAANGTVYVSGGTSGVAKIDRGGALGLLPNLPAGLNYQGLAVDPNDLAGNSLFVAVNQSGGYSRIFRTVDAGTNWSTQINNFNGADYTRKEPDGTLSVTGYWFGGISSLLVNPSNSNELWAADIFGVLRTQDAQNLGSGTSGCTWRTLQKEQEEVVVSALRNAPSGPNLMMGVADVNGFRYLSTNMRPSGTNGNVIDVPAGGSTCSLDFSEADNGVWARTWLNSTRTAGMGGVSSDGGATWLAFGQVATKVVTNSATGAVETWDIGTYLAKQKQAGATSVSLAILPGYSIAPKYSARTTNFYSKEYATVSSRPRIVVNGTTTLYASEDSFVESGSTSAVHGSDTTLKTSYAGGAADKRWIFLKFDISSLPAVSSGVLQLNRVGAAYTDQFSFGVYAVANTAWSEAAINWTNRPAALSSLTSPSVNSDPIADPRSSAMGGRIAVSSTDPNRIVWLPDGTTSKPLYSVDRGVTWTATTGAPFSQMANQFYPGIVIQQLAADRVNGAFYMASFGTNANHTIYRSVDGGVNWSISGTVPAGTGNVWRVQLMAAPAANDLWVSDDGIENSAAGGLWRSTNGGTSWTKITSSSAPITGVRGVSFGKANSGSGYTVFINGFKSGVKGVYRSDDYGATWTKLANVPTVNDIDVISGDRQNYGRVFLGTSGRGTFVGQ